MRVASVIEKYNSQKNKNKVKQTGFERKDYVPNNHRYTGKVSYDLAYASLFDSQIARDLKLMGLI